MEAKLHRDIFSLFYSVWTNPESKIFSIIKYLLENSNENSHSWAIHIRQISKMYGLEDPLDCLRRSPPSKSLYKKHVLTKITAFHEKELRKDALKNDKMRYFDVSLIGLNGRLHPAASNVSTSHNVKTRTYGS